MKPINKLLTALSLTAVLITIERASPTTRILLQPYDFLRLHEVLQMGLITAISVVLSFLILRTVSKNFGALTTTSGTVLGCLFILGTYFYATGNGAHEVASFMFNQFCGGHISSRSCGSMYMNDYFFGDVVYFVGLGLSSLSLILIEFRSPGEEFTAGDLKVTLGNALVLGLSLAAYDGLDRVLVGLVSSTVLVVIFASLLIRQSTAMRALPYSVYSVVGFGVAVVVAVPLRLLR